MWLVPPPPPLFVSHSSLTFLFENRDFFFYFPVLGPFCEFAIIAICPTVFAWNAPFKILLLVAEDPAQF